MILALSAFASIVALIAGYVATIDLATSANLQMSAGNFNELSAKFANA